MPATKPARSDVVTEPADDGMLKTCMINHHKPAPGPVRTFRVVNDLAQLESIHEGAGLTLDDVIRFVSPQFERYESDPYHVAIYHERRVVALVEGHKGGNGYRVLPIDDACVWERRGIALDRGPAPANPHSRGGTFDPTYSEARPLALDVCRRAISEWRSAEAAERTAYARHANSESARGDSDIREAREWERWLTVLSSFAGDARRRACAAVLVITGAIERDSDLCEYSAESPPVALHLGGKHYVVAFDETTLLPKLTVVDEEDFDSEEFGQGEWE